MKSRTLFIIILSFVLLSLLAFGAAVLFLEKNPLPKSVPSPTAPGSGSSLPPIVSSDFAASLPAGTFPAGVKPIDVSVQEVQGNKTARISWDEKEIDVFHIVVFDEELFRARSPQSLVWAISSFKNLPSAGNEIDIKRKDVGGFLPSGYTLGKSISGFRHEPSTNLDGAQLAPGREYYLQLNGFTKEDKLITVNKKFTFIGAQ